MFKWLVNLFKKNSNKVKEDVCKFMATVERIDYRKEKLFIQKNYKCENCGMEFKANRLDTNLNSEEYLNGGCHSYIFCDKCDGGKNINSSPITLTPIHRDYTFISSAGRVKLTMPQYKTEYTQVNLEMLEAGKVDENDA